MKKVPLFWQIFPALVGITLITVGWLAWYGRSAVREFYLNQQAADLEVRAKLFAENVIRRPQRDQPEQLDRLAARLGKATNTRFTLIRADGKVIADSDEEPRRMGDHANRPEIVRTLASGTPAMSIRYSNTLHEEFMYVALRTSLGQREPLIVRAAMPVTGLHRAIGRMERQVVVAALVASLVAVVVSWVIASRISRPLEAMTAHAQRLARGDFAHSVHGWGSREISSLATAMNQMGRDLQDQIETIARQGNDRAAIITSMAEAVIALDRDGHILEVNPAAVGMLNLDTREIHGRLFHEVLRHADLLDFTERLLAEPRTVTDELSISGDPDRHYVAHGNTLRDASDRIMGVIVVLSDITRLRRLETIRREFVANVSHELHTPVTVIKGASETLLDGALDEPEAGRRFALAIQRQSNRLAAVIADTLSLSEIERDAQQCGPPCEPCDVAEMLAEAVEQCQSLADQKNIRLEHDIESGMTIDAHHELLVRAVVNLLDNAIRYSEANTVTRLAARRQDGEIVIRVLDQGCGIAPRHMPRLFERFFRVDPARSRELGGTGLGLSIVKHVALLHGGRVDVESRVGAGSKFSIILPESKRERR